MFVQEGVYPYKYMDDWGKIVETSLPVKNKLYSHLNMENITDADYTCAKKVCKNPDLKIGKKHKKVNNMTFMLKAIHYC